MTVDFADWVNAWDAYRQASWPLLMVFASVAVFAVGLFLALMGSELADDAVRFKRVCVPIGVVLMFVGMVMAIVTVGTTDRPTPPPAPDSFTVVAEQRFGVTDLACADKAGGTPHECSFDDLDSPRYAEWIRDGKAYRGRIVAHGTRVTLAPDAGAEGKEME